MNRSKFFLNRALFPAAFLLATALLPAQEPDRSHGSTDADEQQIVELEPMRVVGSKDNAALLPGSAAFIDTEEIRGQNYDDINRLLQRVPGVYFREEDGFGIFANLSLRGANSARSSKVTMMEDGVLTSPAPYSAPAAYYTPTAGRMHGVEVLKGSSQILYGPETTGGVINYLSTPIPHQRTGYLRASYGTDNDIRLHATYGDAVEAEFGRFDFLLENYHRTNDGFKTIDERPGFNQGNQTGFTKNEPMFKFGWEPNTPHYQRIEFKVGYTELDFNETYLGLSEADFDDDPFRRYAATRFDNIAADHTRTYLRHIVEPTSDLRLTTTAYYNAFDRNWSKIDAVSADGVTYQNPSRALAEGGAFFDVIRGDRAGFFRVGDNARSYASYGLETRVDYQFETGKLDHRLEAGVRLHEDYARRFHEGTIYEQNGAGAVIDANPVNPALHAGSVSRRREEARALAISVQDRIGFGKWAVTPGIRYEHVRFKLREPANPTQNGEASLDTFAPGISVTYDYTDSLTFFSGVHRGTSMPGPAARVKDGIDEETTVSYELGSRFNNRNGFRAELVFFYTDFNDLIVPDSIGSGTTVTENVGEATSYGIEALIGYDPGIAHNWGFRNPNTLALTWTDATLDSDTTSANPESIFSGGQKGDRLPYIPEYAASAGTGLEFSRWSFYLDASWLPATYGTANNGSAQINPINGNPDARFGKTDSRLLIDVSAHYQVSETARAFVGIHNLLDEEYIVSRLPYGPRPGAPITAHIGLEMTF